MRSLMVGIFLSATILTGANRSLEGAVAGGAFGGKIGAIVQFVGPDLLKFSGQVLSGAKARDPMERSRSQPTLSVTRVKPIQKSGSTGQIGPVRPPFTPPRPNVSIKSESPTGAGTYGGKNLVVSSCPIPPFNVSRIMPAADITPIGLSGEFSARGPRN